MKDRAKVRRPSESEKKFWLAVHMAMTDYAHKEWLNRVGAGKRRRTCT